MEIEAIYITAYLKKLDFSPVKYCVKFKVALLVFKCLNNFAPVEVLLSLERLSYEALDLLMILSDEDRRCELLMSLMTNTSTNAEIIFQYMYPM